LSIGRYQLLRQPGSDDGKSRNMINAEAAKSIAQARASEKGWAFVEPAEVIARRGWLGGVVRFEIRTNVLNRGGNARFTVDAETGKILQEGFVSR